MKQYILSALLLLCYTNGLHAQSSNELPLIPYPKNVVIEKDSVIINNIKEISVIGDFPKEKKAFQKDFNISSVSNRKTIKGKTGSATLSTTSGSKQNVVVIFSKVENLGAEAYQMLIKDNTIKIYAKTEAGAFYAVQTLSQLITLYRKDNTVKLPNIKIEDSPTYSWRGFMLDVSRHFFTLEYIKKTIDRMSFYKANKLHLHLSDDQGWRIEIKQYPLLTKVGAYRTFNNQDSACIEKSKENPDFVIDPRFIKTDNGKTVYGGYYTQKEMKELIAYAAEKNIEIIPEIDMPGHFNAAIRAYPFLTGTTKAGWGKDFSVPINPCQENVYAFTQNVLKEIFALFPSKYIHIGADEVEKTTWKSNDACQQLMKDSGIGSVNHLQSYFIHRMQRFVEANGKKMITWDDALEGGVNKNITIMYWRSWVKKAPEEALANGNDLIMSPNEPLYFDYQPNNNSIFNVYHAKIDRTEQNNAHLLLGGQANLWTEMVPTENRADYLIYPRYLALAENLWTSDTSEYASFNHRLSLHNSILDDMGIHYRLPDLSGFAQENVFVDQALLKIKNPDKKNFQIKYTLDGSIPSNQSSILSENGLTIDKNTTVKMAAFNRKGSRGDIYTLQYKKAQYQPNTVLEKSLQSGLQVSYYKGFFNGTSRIKNNPDSSFATTIFSVPTSINAPSFALDYKGYIDVPETGVYSFYLTCDDAGILKIGNEMIVDNDGMHSALEKSGQAALNKGLHPILLRFVEGGGGFTLKLQYSFNGSPLADIPESWLKH
ncbi:MAG: beta-hexosaminidase [Pseudopedobacter saltans]|uniref:beta-N-acetylhexosaminidase n=1 Tax=Pseudopedobacter saltans TaxID=151895 RepID=A0A2W5F1C1_9SPHI|nr:MAG: beta-hexosaminidase [Pseudopedobacter saltans]